MSTSADGIPSMPPRMPQGIFEYWSKPAVFMWDSITGSSSSVLDPKPFERHLTDPPRPWPSTKKARLPLLMSSRHHSYVVLLHFSAKIRGTKDSKRNARDSRRQSASIFPSDTEEECGGWSERILRPFAAAFVKVPGKKRIYNPKSHDIEGKSPKRSGV